MQEYHLSQLAILVYIIKQHIRNYLSDILELVKELWSVPTLELHVVALVESLARAINAEFKPFVATVLPPMLKVSMFLYSSTSRCLKYSLAQLLDGEINKRTAVLGRVFRAIYAFGSNVEEFLHLIIPATMKIVERADAVVPLRVTAVRTIDGLSRYVNFSDHASRILHPFARVLVQERLPPELKAVIMDTLCVLLTLLGSDFAIFVPMLSQVRHLNLVKNPLTVTFRC
jgi:FKBP12-rapamycin complex-associated protein